MTFPIIFLFGKENKKNIPILEHLQLSFGKRSGGVYFFG
jgi:hypothetical protein